MDFVDVRLHGAERWAVRIREWRGGRAPDGATRVLSAAPIRRAGRDVFVHFDNDAKVHAPFDAIRLAERLAEAGRNRGVAK